jgi:hypothetical protein
MRTKWNGVAPCQGESPVKVENPNRAPCTNTPPSHKMHVVQVATLNINGMTTTTRVEMLMDFIYRHDIDIIFLQEVTNPEKLQISGYVLHHNVGTTIRGTAILVRNGMTLTNIHNYHPGA